MNIDDNRWFTILVLFLFLQGIVELNPAFRDYSERTEKLDKVLRELRSNGLFSALQGWREEVS